MENLILWKTIDSTTINGLVICELPPITKPKMRVLETTIDGVDGSIIEDLGYESYDKTIKIGLSKNYDINEIIEYFSGEGNLILSNEKMGNGKFPYYKAKIIEQIDYERLLRFKTANVKFRVQPYKYLFNEKTQTITENGSKVNNQGLEVSKPKMTIFGSGTIQLSVNNLLVFEYTFPEDETSVVIDSENQDAYLGNVLKNRNMTGEFPILNPGENTISWDGNITKIEVDANSRWL